MLRSHFKLLLHQRYPNKDHLSTKANIFGFQGLSMYTGLSLSKMVELNYPVTNEVNFARKGRFGIKSCIWNSNQWDRVGDNGELSLLSKQENLRVLQRIWLLPLPLSLFPSLLLFHFIFSLSLSHIHSLSLSLSLSFSLSPSHFRTHSLFLSFFLSLSFSLSVTLSPLKRKFNRVI